MNIYVVIVILVMVVLLIAPYLTRRWMYNQLIKELGQKEYDAFNKRLDSNLCIFLFRPFNREFMRLNGTLAENDAKKVTDQLNKIDTTLKLSAAQKNAVAEKGFYFYMEHKNYEGAEKMLKTMQSSGKTVEGLHQMQMLYDILAAHKSSYIGELQQKIDHLSEADANGAGKVQLGIFQYMQGLQYSYINEKKKAKQCLDKAKDNCRGTIYEAAIKEAAAGLN